MKRNESEVKGAEYLGKSFCLLIRKLTYIANDSSESSNI